jgi:SagB-type dehydrogenase family enzyme
VPADFLGPEGACLLDFYIIVNAVEGLPAGAYFFSPRGGLELLQEGNFREEAGHLCFEQALGADASAVVFFLAGLGEVLARYGNRGYRAAQLEAGILGGKIYLCVHSLGLGASGITFYDDDVTSFFSPHAAGKSPIFVVTLGNPDPRNQVRPFRSRVAVRLDALARGAKNAPE